MNKYQKYSSIWFFNTKSTHPTNSKAPRITTQNGSSFGSGIYYSTNASHSLLYSNNTNTILVFTALLKRAVFI